MGEVWLGEHRKDKQLATENATQIESIPELFRNIGNYNNEKTRGIIVNLSKKLGDRGCHPLVSTSLCKEQNGECVTCISSKNCKDLAILLNLAHLEMSIGNSEIVDQKISDTISDTIREISRLVLLKDNSIERWS